MTLWGVHTGDSYCTAPMLTISPELQKKLQDYSYKIVEAIRVIGGTNIQFAHDPKTGRIVVIEINPRTSRSSALASKATGFPIALISAKLACGVTLDEIPYWRDGSLEKYTPSGDYVVVKFPRFAFEKFRGVQDKLGTQMKAVGEVMSIGKTYKEAFQKAIRSLENGRYGLGFARDFHQRPLSELMDMLKDATSERQFIMYEALRKGASVEKLHELTYIKPWFIEQMKELVNLEEEISSTKVRCSRTTFSLWPRETALPIGTWQSCSLFRRRRSGCDAESWALWKYGSRFRSAGFSIRPIIIQLIMDQSLIDQSPTVQLSYQIKGRQRQT